MSTRRVCALCEALPTTDLGVCPVQGVVLVQVSATRMLPVCAVCARTITAAFAREARKVVAPSPPRGGKAS